APRHPIELNLDPELPLVDIDKDKIEQVLLNLLSNAVKYSPGGGTIALTTRVEGELVHVFVRDSGLGIPADSLEKVFERYSRLESGATRYIQGTGLGLPIARQIIEIEQVLLNLLSNAVKYSPGGGTIALTTRVEGELVHVFVRDSGLGIPADSLEKVFERYSRLESGATRYIQGTGLGLPIARQIIEMH